MLDCTATFRAVDLGSVDAIDFSATGGNAAEAKITTAELGWSGLIGKSGPLVLTTQEGKAIILKAMRLCQADTEIRRGLAHHALSFRHAGKRKQNAFVSMVRHSLER